MSGAEFVSPATRLSAADWKATRRPSAEMTGWAVGRSASTGRGDVAVIGRKAGGGPRLTRVVAPRRRSRTKMSVRRLVSAGTRLVASEAKATKRPSAEIDGAAPPRSAWAPPTPTLTRSIVPVTRSKTKASVAPLVSPGTRLAAALAKATARPSADRTGAELG